MRGLGGEGFIGSARAGSVPEQAVIHAAVVSDSQGTGVSRYVVAAGFGFTQPQPLPSTDGPRSYFLHKQSESVLNRLPPPGPTPPSQSCFLPLHPSSPLPLISSVTHSMASS